MKNNIYKTFVVLVTIFSLYSCNFIDHEMNDSPNSPTVVSPDLMLPGIQAGIAYAIGGEGLRAPMIWTQQYYGRTDQMEQYGKYNFRESDAGNMWEFLYADLMKNTGLMIDAADTQGKVNLSGIGKVLMAYQLGIATSLWGDVPYTEAFQSVDNLSPVYDGQVDVYGDIVELLDEAIIQFSTGSDVYSNDFFYGGDVAKWTSLAKMLKVRYALHLSKMNGDAAYANVRTLLSDAAITDNSNDALMKFGLNATENSPLFDFSQARVGYLGMSKTLIDMMNAVNDPRLPFYATAKDDGTYEGGAPGEPGNSDASDPKLYFNPDAAVPYITYTEIKFIEAEAEFNGGTVATAASALNDAIISSLTDVGVDIADADVVAWIGVNASFDATTVSQKAIIEAKYIALHGQIEVWNDLRRTGFPVLTPASTGQVSTIPVRWPYAMDENNYNSNTPELAGSLGLTTPHEIYK